MFDSPGVVESDNYSSEKCEKKDDNNKCIEQCIAKKLKNPPPKYSVDLSNGENCQTYANSIVAECEAQCHVKH